MARVQKLKTLRSKSHQIRGNFKLPHKFFHTSLLYFPPTFILSQPGTKPMKAIWHYPKPKKTIPPIWTRHEWFMRRTALPFRNWRKNRSSSCSFISPHTSISWVRCLFIPLAFPFTPPCLTQCVTFSCHSSYSRSLKYPSRPFYRLKQTNTDASFQGSVE